jgi:hypothetical protein
LHTRHTRIHRPFVPPTLPPPHNPSATADIHAATQPLFCFAITPPTSITLRVKLGFDALHDTPWAHGLQSQVAALEVSIFFDARKSQATDLTPRSERCLPLLLVSLLLSCCCCCCCVPYTVLGRTHNRGRAHPFASQAKQLADQTMRVAASEFRVRCVYVCMCVCVCVCVYRRASCVV